MKKHRKKLLYIPIMFVGLLMLLPLCLMVTNSFLGVREIQEAYGIVLEESGEEFSFRILPQYFTLRPYVELLLDSPDFFVMFWNSSRQVFPILLGQIVIGMPAAWAFSRFQFRGRRILFFGYMVLMILPFQVTMVSNYILLSKLSLMDTHLGLIVSGIFSTFPIFLMEKFFKALPEAMLDAARVDGASELQIFIKLGVPLGMPGMMSSVILCFLEYWNAIEAPMTFLKTKAKFPLSLYLPNITTDQLSSSFAASIVMMIPAVLIFLWGRDYLQQGIEASGLKE